MAALPPLVTHLHGLTLQVNGKMRGAVEVDVSIDQEGAVAAARGVGAVAKQLEGKEVGLLHPDVYVVYACMYAKGGVHLWAWPWRLSKPGSLPPASGPLMPQSFCCLATLPAGEEGNFCGGQNPEHHCGQVTGFRPSQQAVF